MPITSPAILSEQRSFRIESLDAVEHLEKLAPEWNDLWQRCPRATPFQSPAWLLPWVRNLYQGGEIFMLCLRHGMRLVAVAPLFVYGQPGGLRQLSALGTGVSDYVDILVEPEFELSAGQVLLKQLTTGGRWDVCELQDVPAGSSLVGLRAEPIQCGVCPVLRLPGTIDELHSRLSGKFKKNLRRQTAQLGCSGDVQFETATRSTWPQYLEALFRLHAARWELRRQPGMLAAPNLQTFHRQVCDAFAENGWLRFHGLRYNGTMAAVYYGFASRGRTYYYLGGFDPALARFGPGTLVLQYAIEQAILEGCQEFDFLRDREEYKYMWGAQDQATYRLRFGPAQSL